MTRENDLVERRVELITNALLHLPIRGAELQFAARQVELALRPEVQALEAELHLMKTSGIIEVAIRNPSVFDYMNHWETRAERAEAELARKTEALRTFAMDGWADENGWTDRGCPNDRVSDWFGPSDFRAARSALEEKTDV